MLVITQVFTDPKNRFTPLIYDKFRKAISQPVNELICHPVDSVFSCVLCVKFASSTNVLRRANTACFYVQNVIGIVSVFFCF